jgi:DNA-directed RNA polymerase subunit alpha
MQEFERASFHKEEVNEENNTGSFVFEPLERGFGTTIGNAICQVMRSNLPGTGAVAFKVEGVNPQDTLISGVKEDVTGLGLNVKALQFVGDPEGLTKLTVSKTGPAVVTAMDIVCPEEIEIVDPDQEICTITDDSAINLDVYVAKNCGFKNRRENEATYDLPEDVVVLDTMFTPIRTASYLSEPARVGQNIKYDKVHINVTTDGTITPFQAISSAASILVDNLDVIVPVADLHLEECFVVQQPQVEEVKKTNTMMIEDLDLSVRSYNCLKRAGIQTVEELTQKTEDEMMHVKNLGKKSLKEVKDKMYQLGLSFKSYE